MDAFPLTNNGKIDRRALPAPTGDSLPTLNYVPPQGDMEVAIAAIWSDLLKVEKIGRHDNFFVLGGHSLVAVRFVNCLRSTLDIDLRLHVLFDMPTLSGLSLNLSASSTSKDTLENEYSVLLPLKPQGSRPPLFCIHPGQGLAWSYRRLAQHLHPEQSLFGLQARGLDGNSPVASSFEELALDYVNQIRKVQLRGPYHLLGWSFGGKVAHSMATILQSQGETVALLAIMDTTPKKPVENQVPMLDVRSFTAKILASVEPDHVAEDDTRQFDEYLTRLIGASSSEDSLAMKRRMGPVMDNISSLNSHFNPSVYSGDILFFRSTVAKEYELIDPACWEPYVRGRIEVYDVACVHAEMDKAEHIGVIGRIVASAIENAVITDSDKYRLDVKIVGTYLGQRPQDHNQRTPQSPMEQRLTSLENAAQRLMEIDVDVPRLYISLLLENQAVPVRDAAPAERNLLSSKCDEALRSIKMNENISDFEKIMQMASTLSEICCNDMLQEQIGFTQACYDDVTRVIAELSTSIAELEEARTKSESSYSNTTNETSDQRDELLPDIEREEGEIFALEQMMSEKRQLLTQMQKELAALADMAASNDDMDLDPEADANNTVQILEIEYLEGKLQQLTRQEQEQHALYDALNREREELSSQLHGGRELGAQKEDDEESSHTFEQILNIWEEISQDENEGGDLVEPKGCHEAMEKASTLLDDLGRTKRELAQLDVLEYDHHIP
ncbi:hypothetical protein BG004_007357 [Podila humilis]|nr:hypothetical protein BG004_007357 [Podila humilis]